MLKNSENNGTYNSNEKKVSDTEHANEKNFNEDVNTSQEINSSNEDIIEEKGVELEQEIETEETGAGFKGFDENSSTNKSDNLQVDINEALKVLDTEQANDKNLNEDKNINQDRNNRNEDNIEKKELEQETNTKKEGAVPEVKEANSIAKRDALQMDFDNALKVTIKVSDGTEFQIFSKGPYYSEDLWPINCHLCEIDNIKNAEFLRHLKSTNHQYKITQPPPNAVKFRQGLIQNYGKPEYKINNPIKIYPGEIIRKITPHYYDRLQKVKELKIAENYCEEKITIVQNDLVYQKNKETPIIGVCYVLKIVNEHLSKYLCVLCSEHYDDSHICDHLFSVAHQIKYLKKHFPNLYKKLQNDLSDKVPKEGLICSIFRDVYKKFEDLKGLRIVRTIDSEVFDLSREVFTKRVLNYIHYCETMIEIPKEDIDKLIENISKGENAAEFDGTNLNRSDQETNKFCESRKRETSIHDNEPPPKKREVTADSDTETFALEYYEDQDLKQEVPLENMNVLKNEPVHAYNKKAPVIGLSYILKMLNNENTIEYFCVLCNSRCPRTIYEHLVSSGHEMSYLNKHFPNLLKKLQFDLRDLNPINLRKKLIREIFRTIYRKVEEQKGLRKIHLIDGQKFAEDRNPFVRKVIITVHYDEKDIDISEEEIEELIERKRKATLVCEGEIKPLVDQCFCGQNDCQVADIDDTDNNWKRYSKIVGATLNDLKKEYETYRLNGSSHPKYIKEQEKFSSKKNIQTLKGNMISNEKKIKAEWTGFWPKLLNNLYKTDIERKIFEIKRNLHLPCGKRTTSPIRRGRSQIRAPQLPPKSFTSEPTYRRERRYSKSPEYVNHQLQLAEHQVSTEPPKPLNVISVLRQIIILEEELGSLGPKALQFLSRAVLFEKENDSPANELLKEREFYVFFVTVKEKLKGQLMANLVEMNKTKAAKSAVTELEALLDMFEDFIRQNARGNPFNSNEPPPRSDSEMNTTHSEHNNSFSFGNDPLRNNMEMNKTVNCFSNQNNRQTLFEDSIRQNARGNPFNSNEPPPRSDSEMNTTHSEHNNSFSFGNDLLRNNMEMNKTVNCFSNQNNRQTLFEDSIRQNARGNPFNSNEPTPRSDSEMNTTHSEHNNSFSFGNDPLRNNMEMNNTVNCFSNQNNRQTLFEDSIRQNARGNPFNSNELPPRSDSEMNTTHSEHNNSFSFGNDLLRNNMEMNKTVNCFSNQNNRQTLFEDSMRQNARGNPFNSNEPPPRSDSEMNTTHFEHNNSFSFGNDLLRNNMEMNKTVNCFSNQNNRQTLFNNRRNHGVIEMANTFESYPTAGQENNLRSDVLAPPDHQANNFRRNLENINACSQTKRNNRANFTNTNQYNRFNFPNRNINSSQYNNPNNFRSENLDNELNTSLRFSNWFNTSAEANRYQGKEGSPQYDMNRRESQVDFVPQINQFNDNNQFPWHNETLPPNRGRGNTIYSGNNRARGLSNNRGRGLSNNRGRGLSNNRSNGINYGRGRRTTPSAINFSFCNQPLNARFAIRGRRGNFHRDFRGRRNRGKKI